MVKSVIKYIVLTLVALFVTNSCSDDEDKDPIMEEVSRVVLVYMAADNNLNDYSYDNIRGLMHDALGNLNGGKLLVYQDAQDSNEPQLLEIYQDGGKIKKKSLKSYKDQNSASTDVLATVIDDAFSFYQSDSKGLMLWSHGTSWLPADTRIHTRSFGEDGPNKMEIYELAKVLPDNFFDFIIFDACLMSSVEVCYELRTNAKYIVSSPTEIFAEGFPYHLIVGDLFSSKDLESSLKSICDTYYSYYLNHKESVYRFANISLIKTEKLDELLALSKRNIAKYGDLLSLDITDIQPMYFNGLRRELLFDLRDFMQKITSTTDIEEYDQLLQDVVLFKESTKLIYSSSLRTEFPINKYSGLSIFIPQTRTPLLNDWYYQYTEWGRVVYE